MVRPFRAQSSLWTGTQGVALGARNAPLGLNTTAHPYCTGRTISDPPGGAGVGLMAPIETPRQVGKRGERKEEGEPAEVLSCQDRLYLICSLDLGPSGFRVTHSTALPNATGFGSLGSWPLLFSWMVGTLESWQIPRTRPERAGHRGLQGTGDTANPPGTGWASRAPGELRGGVGFLTPPWLRSAVRLDACPFGTYTGGPVWDLRLQRPLSLDILG